MKIYTSYFAQMRNFPSNMIGLSSVMYQPKWLTRGRSQNGIIWFPCSPLQPGKSCENLCSGQCNPKHPQDCQFLKNYRAQLNEIDFKNFILHIEALCEEVCKEENFDDADFAILFYEVPQNQCSERGIVQQWFKDNGVEIYEWEKGI